MQAERELSQLAAFPQHPAAADWGQSALRAKLGHCRNVLFLDLPPSLRDIPPVFSKGASESNQD
jgi:hypothetical protein